MPSSDLLDTTGDAVGAGGGHDGLASGQSGRHLPTRGSSRPRDTRHDLMTETRHTVVAGSCRRLDQPAMNSWKADSRFGGSAVTLHWRSVSPIGDRMPRRS